ncbi:hypothetical protein HMI46_26290 [Paenibacillus alvei]|uniref:Phage-Barnase-EndoU-ColicinE5/D-RelE like nuclease 3 domain-containing protein n=1 Tax=Paenibacillus alvei TaxID=44250 RepID=A0AAP7A1M9_PAEAL|nr:hypothetical protein [Paenibacillus alvei]
MCSIDINASEIQIVGKINTAAIKRLINVDFQTEDVKMYPGALKHIRRNHPGILEDYGHLIPDIIANPDFVGQNPKELNSVELVKAITPHLLLAIKLDPSGYLFVSSFYDMHNGPVKLQKRLASGRLVPFTAN